MQLYLTLLPTCPQMELQVVQAQLNTRLMPLAGPVQPSQNLLEFARLR